MKIDKWQILGLLAIMLFVFLIRSHNFFDGLYFEADQVRNANNAMDVLEGGFEELPLLGPKAGGTNFHLGPISYYFEFFSGLIFGTHHPAIFAFSNFLLLLLAIPLFYYFLSYFFSKEQNFLITSLFASSYLMTQYARFSWNPNGIIFWGLLFILALYKIKKEKDNLKREKWFLVLVLSYGISSQLHVLALLGYPLVFVTFLFICFLLKIFSQERRRDWLNRKGFIVKIKRIFEFWRESCVLLKIRPRFWVASFFIITLLYLPLIVYDVNNQGANFKNFIGAFGVKGEKREMFEKINKISELYSDNYVLTISSFNNKEINTELFGLIFIAISLLIVFYLFRKNKTTRLSKTFLILTLTWFFIFVAIHYKLAFDIDQPRFWFPSFFVPYIFLAIITTVFWENKIGRFLAIIFCGAMIFFNLSAIFNWYGKVEGNSGSDFLTRKTTSSTLMQDDFISYGELEEVVDWIKKESEESLGKACFNSPSTYLASYKYIFNQKYPDFDSRRINKTIEMNLADNCDIFIIDHSGNSKENIEEKFLKKEIEIELEKGVFFQKINIWKVVQ